MDKKNVFPIDKNYLAFNVKCITRIGSWNPYASGAKYWLYQFYIFYYNYLIFPLKCTGDFLQTLDASTLPQFTQAFASVVVHVVGAIKAVSITNSQSKISLLMELLNWERHLPCTPQMTHYRNEVISKTMAQTKKWTFVLVVIVLQNTFSDLFTTLTTANCTITDYPMSYLRINYVLTSMTCRQTAIFDFVLHNFASANIIINDSFLMSVMSFLTVQLKLLNFRLANCHKTYIDFDDEVKVNMNIIHFECCEILPKESKLDPNVEFVKCIKNHQKVLEIFATFNDIYINILLPQLCSSLFILSLMGCQLILTKYDAEENIHDMVHPIVFCIWATLELFAYCWCGNSIVAQSDILSSSAYNTKWYNIDKTFRTNVSIFLCLVRKPLVISVGGILDLSAITFKNVLTKAYSLVALLKNSSD